ncbi:hypothetical protein MJL81_31630, partial [Salmonella enterica subsp. enterica serovar Anatum]|nr:hypothetical protein [Salmonella enterica subsp. enterica serovar Anatum]
KGEVEVKQGAGTYFIDSLEKINQKALLPYSDIGPFELLQARHPRSRIQRLGGIYDGHCRTLCHGPENAAVRIKQQHPVMHFHDA